MKLVIRIRSNKLRHTSTSLSMTFGNEINNAYSIPLRP